MKNIGKISTRWLNSLGIYTKIDLEKYGSITIYRLLQEAGYPVSLNLVYAIEGALQDLHWSKLPEDLKAELHEQIRAIPRSRKKSRAPQRQGNRQRCPWCLSDPLYINYHDTEWGIPVHDDQKLFEMLTLEGAQAGLSWLTILKKREAYRKAFALFDPKKVSRFGEGKIQVLLLNEGIVRNQLKIKSTIRNAKAFLKVQQEFGSFDRYLWQFVGGKPKRNAWKTMKELPPRTADSDAMSKDLKQRGFSFVGSTICYAFMQAVGMVNDHLVTCFRYRER